MEVQLTDFENAAFTVVSILLTRAILIFDLQLYIPISLVDLNMEAAHARGATTSKKFHFRHDCFDADAPDKTLEMTLNQIMNGMPNVFPGLIPIVHQYLDLINCPVTTRTKLDGYCELISRRASGDVDTTATWMRKFVKSHPQYKHDSIVPPEVAFDLLNRCKSVADGSLHDKDLLGNAAFPPLQVFNPYYVPLQSKATPEVAAARAAMLSKMRFGRKRHLDDDALMTGTVGSL